MKTGFIWKRYLIGFLMLALLTACAGVAPETPSQKSAATRIPPDSTTMPPTSTAVTPTNTPEPTGTPVPSATNPIPAATPESPTAIANLSTKVTGGIVYANVDDQVTKLDVYAPRKPGPWPVVVIVHGFGQPRSAMGKLARAIASRGAVVFNAEVLFSVPFLTGIERLACAIRFARAMAPDYNGDPSRITIFGNSAGAASGVVVGLAGDDFDSDCIVNAGSALPDALVAYEGPYEFATTSYGSVVDHTYLKQENPEALEAIDPYSHIGRNPDLQVRLIHGDDVDDLWYEVIPEESVGLHRVLAEAGYDVELIIVEEASHVELGKQKSEVFALTVELVIELAHSSSQ